MRFFSFGTILLFLIFLKACSTYPIPDTVLKPDTILKNTTVEIVHKIRCEARQAMISEILLLLRHPKFSDEKSKTLADLIDNGLSFEEADKYPLNPRVKKAIEKFRHAGLGYTFTFTMTENNNLIGDAGLSMPSTGGNLAVALNAGAKKERINERTVKLSDSFSDLVINGEKLCNHFPLNTPNALYPIAGIIGMKKPIDTFIKFVNTTNKVGTFTDELTFTTTINAKVNPTVSLGKMVPKELRLVSAGIDANASRKDVHKLTLTFTDQREEKPEARFKTVKLGEGVFLKVPLPHRRKKAFTKPKGNFSISKTEAKRIKKKTLTEIDRQEFLSDKRKIEELID